MIHGAVSGKMPAPYLRGRSVGAATSLFPRAFAMTGLIALRRWISTWIVAKRPD